jgi:acyl-CoA synthetase (AMP-forming)/AMP-acid ligase II
MSRTAYPCRTADRKTAPAAVEGPLPKTGTGKILKRELRERYWSGKKIRVTTHGSYPW